MDTATFWEESSPAAQHVKFESGSSTESSAQACKEEQSIFHYCDGNLNFATVATSEDDDFSFHKKKVSRDPMSHRIIEKRRRDRMNNCLADLSRLIPADYLKKGRGRIEKTEIIEMAIKHMKHLQSHACRQQDSCELTQQHSPEEAPEAHPAGGPIVLEHYRLGYQECLSETMHFMVEVEGFFAGDPLCVQLINHLQKHCDKILKGDRLNFPRTHLGETTSTSSGSTGSGSYNHHHSSSIPLGSSGLGSSSSPGSGSGSCSDSSRTENKDSGVGSRMPTSQSGSMHLVQQVTASDESCCDEGLINITGPSQLREMLTSSNLNSLATSQAAANTSQHSLTAVSHQNFHAPTSPGLSHSIGNPSGGITDHVSINGGCAASLYKFKNNIKQRFTAEHLVDDRRQEKSSINRDVPTNLHHGTKRRRFGPEVNDDNSLVGNTLLTLSQMGPTQSKRRDSETCSVPSPPPSPTPKYPPTCSPSPDMSRVSPIPQCPQKPIPTPTYGIPIFALHSKGSFYIPLTLDAEVLAPYLAAFGFGPDSNLQNISSNSVVLHPVTISVNFQQMSHYRTNHPKHRQINQCSQILPWNNDSNGFMPLPKWSVCSSDRA